MNDGHDMLRSSPDALPYAADWFEEAGRLDEADSLRSGAILPEKMLAYGYGYGDGYGSGYGSGYGYGYGSGSGSGYGYGDGYGYGSGSGSGYGDGYGDGYGYGYGSGSGSGYGDGDGDGDGSGSGDGYGYGSGDGSGYGDGSGVLTSTIRLLSHPEKTNVNECDPGQLYMFALGEGWMFVGRFVRPTGMFGGVFEEVVNICRTGGTAWPDLLAGQGRAGATFVAYPPGEVPFPIVRFAFKWAGELPKDSRGDSR